MKKFLLTLLTFSMMLFALTGCFHSSEEKINLEVSKEEDQYFEIVDYGYSANRSELEKNVLYVNFAGKIKNTSNEMIHSSDIELSLYDKDDNFVGDGSMTAFGVMPGDTIPIDFIVETADAKPVRAELIISDTRPENHEKRKAAYIKMSDFEISNVECKTVRRDVYWTGTIKNKSNKMCDGLEVVILYKKDGKIVDSVHDTNNLRDIKPGESREFKINDVPNSYDSYEVMVRNSFFVGMQ